MSQEMFAREPVQTRWDCCHALEERSRRDPTNAVRRISQEYSQCGVDVGSGEAPKRLGRRQANVSILAAQRLVQQGNCMRVAEPDQTAEQEQQHELARLLRERRGEGLWS